MKRKKKIVQEWYSVKEAAAILGIHHNTVRKRCADGTIKALKTGSMYKINRAVLYPAGDDA